MIKVGIVGLGWWGKQLLDYFRSTERVKVTPAFDNLRKKLYLSFKELSFFS